MFYQLTEENIAEYLKRTEVIQTVFDDSHADIEVKDLAEGNVNLIFRAWSKSDPVKKSVILKQALPYARRYPEFKMPQERARVEYEILALENKYCPGLAPKVYLFDKEMYTTIMEDLNQHIIMRYGLMKQVIYPKFAEHIGIFLARTLFYTSDFYLSSAEKKEMVGRFINPVMAKVTEDLVFTQPYIEHENNHWTPQLTPQVQEIHNNEALRAEMLLLKEAFMANAQALIHGDLHTGSIMVNKDETRVIDPEFGFFGPMGFDIGAVLGNLVLSYASQEYHAQEKNVRQEYREWLLKTIAEIWEYFENEFKLLWDTKRNKDEWPSETLKDHICHRLLQDTAGFGAAKTMRRIIGLAQVPDMWTIPDDATRAVAQSLALNAAQAWVMNRRSISSIQDMIDMVKTAEPSPAVLEQVSA